MEHKPIAQPKPAGTVEIWHECESCAGVGHVYDVVRVRGEYIDADYQARLCDDCGGDGGHFAEPVCDCCELPLTNGVCLPCTTFTAPVSDGRTGVWL